MCPKYVILIVLYFCLQFMSLNYFDILFCDLSFCDLCFCFLCWFCFYITRSALQVIIINNLLISSAQVSTMRFSNARYKEQNNLNVYNIS